MKKLILVSSLFTLSTLANLGGQWTGFGEWKYDGSGVRCTPMQLSFIETENSLHRLPTKFDCDIVVLDIGEASWKKENGNLISEEGEIIGSYKNSEYSFVEKYEDSLKVESKILIDGLHLDYQEHWYGAAGNDIYEITGRMFKKE